MSKQVKEMVMDELRGRLNGARDLLVVDVSRMDAFSTNKLRLTLRQKQISMLTVRNSLARRVLDESAAHLGHAGQDGTGVGTHFRVRIASPLFDGKTKVARHRLVYDALRDYIERDRGVHALAIETP